MHEESHVTGYVTSIGYRIFSIPYILAVARLEESFWSRSMHAISIQGVKKEVSICLHFLTGEVLSRSRAAPDSLSVGCEGVRARTSIDAHATAAAGVLYFNKCNYSINTV